MRECYSEIRFQKKSLELIDKMNTIIEDYQQQGYVLTVRQLYYQLVAKAWIENTERSYKNVASLVNDGRVSGLIDWDAIEDRTRSFTGRSRWDSPNQILDEVAKQYHTDPWLGQKTRPFVVVEKEALSGVFQRVCHEFDVPMLSARGYPSASVVREFANSTIADNAKKIVILHFGDHDPSGLDMTRDLIDRFALYSRDAEFELKRLALNFDQIEELKPPPNPAKQTDARFVRYKNRFGMSSWELDALPPDVLSGMARKEILKYVNAAAWKRWQADLDKTKKSLKKLAETYRA